MNICGSSLITASDYAETPRYVKCSRVSDPNFESDPDPFSLSKSDPVTCSHQSSVLDPDFFLSGSSSFKSLGSGFSQAPAQGMPIALSDSNPDV